MSTIRPKSFVRCAAFPLVALALLGGCGTTSTLQRRLNDHPEVLAVASPRQRELAQAGFVDRGFPAALVQLVMEKPTRITHDDATGATYWYYHNLNSSHATRVSVGETRIVTSIDGSRRRSTNLSDAASGTSAPIVLDPLENYMLITLIDDVVTRVEFFGQP